MEDITCLLHWKGNQISAPISSLSDENINHTWKLSSLGEEEILPVSLIQQVCSVSQLSKQYIEKKLKTFSFENNIQNSILIQLQNLGKPIGALLLMNNNPCIENIFTRNLSSMEQIARQISTVLEYNLLVSNIENILERENKKTKQLEKLNAMKDQFVNSISKELRSPLLTTLQLANELKSTLEITYEQNQLCDMIISSGNGLLVVINDILDFQACQNSQLTLTYSNFDLRSCLDECIQIVRENSITLNLITDHPINHHFIIQSDVVRLKQVLVHLLSNALKFTEKGNVILQVKILNLFEFLDPASDYHDNKERELLFPDEVELQFCVIDTGIGISDSHQKNLFQAFSQLDCSSTRKYSGTGLGLALAQQIVQKLHSQSCITCQSTVGVGSTFSFSYKCKLIDFSIYDPPEILKNNQIHLFFYSSNEYTISALCSQANMCSISSDCFHIRDNNSSSIHFSPGHLNIVVIDFEFYDSFDLDEIRNQFDPRSCIFISLVHTNKMNYQHSHQFNATLYCPLTKFSLVTAITTALNRNKTK